MDNQQPNQTLQSKILELKANKFKIRDISELLNISAYKVHRTISECDKYRSLKSQQNLKIFELRFNRDYTIEQITREVDLKYHQIQYRIARSDEIMKLYQINQTDSAYYEDLRRLIKTHVDFDKIMELLDINDSTFNRIVNKCDLLDQDPVMKFVISKPEIKEFLFQSYYIEKLTMSQIARKLGFKKREDVGRMMIYFGLPSSRMSYLNDDLLYNEYSVNKLSIYDISEKYGIHSHFVREKLKELGIFRSNKYYKYTELGKKLLVYKKSNFIEFMNKNKMKYSIYEMLDLLGCTKYRLIYEFESYHLNYLDYFKIDDISKLSYPEYRVFKEILKHFDDIEKDEIIIHDRYSIKPYELDLHIKSLNIAFEINPCFTHELKNDDLKDQLFEHQHRRKTKLCQNSNIKLIHIWEHDLNNLDSVFRKIKSNEIDLIENKYISKDKYTLEDILKSYSIISEKNLYYVYNEKYKLVNYFISDKYEFKKIKSLLSNKYSVVQSSGVWEVQRL